MKKTITSLSLVTTLVLSAPMVMAGGKHHKQYRGGEMAKVTYVQPVYREVRVNSPSRECWDEAVRHPQQQSYTSTIAGGIIGGVVGNQFGGGNGRTAMTVAGTLLGGSVGRDLGNRYQNDDYRYQQQCQVHDRYHTERHIEGYDVSYRYKGREYSTFMNYHPGEYVPVDVVVSSSPRRYY